MTMDVKPADAATTRRPVAQRYFARYATSAPPAPTPILQVTT